MADRVALVMVPKAIRDGRVTCLRGREGLSEISTFTIEVTSSSPQIAPGDVLGEPISVELQADERGVDPRVHGGVITEIEATGPLQTDQFGYIITFASPLFLTTLNTTSRIFQNMTVVDAAKAVFEDYGADIAVKFQATGALITREYLVQYSESDFEFLTRIFAEEGLFFIPLSNAQAAGDFPNEIIVADNANAYSNHVQGNVTLDAARFGSTALTSWRPRHRLNTGGYQHSDYNSATSTQVMTTNTKPRRGDQRYQAAQRNVHHGRFGVRGDGETLVNLRMEEEENASKILSGESGYVHFQPGVIIKLDHAPMGMLDESMVITAVEHEYDLEVTSGSSNDPVINRYRNKFLGAPSGWVFRPPSPPRRQMPGLQTAVVVGPEGKVIHTDELYRVKVLFHWHLDGVSDENASCWLRCVQQWAGPKIGSVWVPRIGMEVLVDFIEGDPDRPVVVGCAYNSGNKPHYPLKEGTDMGSGWRTETGATSGNKVVHELFFWDEQGKEEIFFHSGKDFRRVVDHDDKLKVSNDQFRTISKNRTVDIEEGDDTFTITKGNRDQKLADGNDSLTLSNGDLKVTLDNGEAVIDVSKKITLKVGSSSIVIDPQNIKLQTTNITEQAQMNYKASAGTAFKISAGANFQASAGASFKASAGAAMQLSAAASFKASGGAMAEVSGGGMLTLKGGMVMIN